MQLLVSAPRVGQLDNPTSNLVLASLPQISLVAALVHELGQFVAASYVEIPAVTDVE